MKRQGQASNSSGLGRIAPCRIQIRQGATIVQSQEDDGAECQSWSNRALFNDRDMLGDCGVLPLRLQTVVSIELPEEIHGVLFCLGFSQEICGLRCNGPYAGSPEEGHGIRR